MLDFSSFLMRWLFLSNMVRDVAEIQTLPLAPHNPPPPPPPIPQTCRQVEDFWKEQCLRGILAYPPGQQRLMVMDALRVELVQLLAKQVQHSSKILADEKRANEQTKSRNPISFSRIDSGGNNDPYLDADVEILREFENLASNEQPSGDSEGGAHNAHNAHDARLIISGEGTNVESDSETESDETDQISTMFKPPSPVEVQAARRHLLSIRENMPQLVSAVLKSPPAYDNSPIQRLRELLLDRCSKDPSWGIELCWLLEAEVGRTWKTLFEHRQQTGRRLIVVLPAEKAAVLAQIGSEKREAFDLLQDAEQATAYGHTVDEHGRQPHSNHDGEPTLSTKLPASLSLRRCSHFGDTMHFIDLLTTISLDLRKVPIPERSTFLQNSLHEMNRRIRRRMVSLGETSLDVEDGRNFNDWPTVHDVTYECLHHSFHFPLVPQTGLWSNGEEPPPSNQALPVNPEVVRVLNIIASESRILASRERCPYLIQMEVADAGVEGDDARLYSTKASGLGATLNEALRMRDTADIPSTYQIPSELTHTPTPQQVNSCHPQQPTWGNAQIDTVPVYQPRCPPRGGGQASSTIFGDPDGGYAVTPDYREQEYQSLHEEMHMSRPQQEYSQNSLQTPPVTLGADLLNHVFGERWQSQCKRIKENSPYGGVKGWRLANFIIKAGEDIRREALVMQVISKFRSWFQEIPEPFRPFMRPYTIMCVGGDAGLLECLPDVRSVDEVKKKTDGFTSLRDYFERAYGRPQLQRTSPPPPGVLTFEQAQDNFLRSLVGYSLVCYALQIKDRHNANILLDREGHIMHIDFGFVLGDTPKMAKVPIFSERAPFKLSQEFWEVLGGWDGLGVRFLEMFGKAFECVSAHADEVASLVEATVLALTSNAAAARVRANEVRHRLQMRGPPGSKQQSHFIIGLVDAARTSLGTSTYDWLQQTMNGYL